MAPLTIVSSDQPGVLIERLALDLANAPLGPFDEETIIVQSRGTERWIRQELARRHGCAAGLSFPFAASFFRELAESLTASDASASAVASRASTSRADEAFGREALTWQIYDLLEGKLCDEAGFETLRAFVTEAHGRDARKTLGLARVLAGRFTEYQLYRPDVLDAWEHDASTASDWQATLWRCICASNATSCHSATQYRQALDTLLDAGSTPATLPPRLSVFGVDTLPPIYVELLHAVSRRIPVRVYLQAPPRATWQGETRNPLFASFGRVVQEFVELLETLAPGDAPVRWEEHHAADARAPEPSMLAQLQADIRAGVERGPESGAAPRLAHSADRRDESLSLHRCHSPMREMEVLRDQLLAALASDPTLRPHDILLLVPDVATYAPFVDAVFGVGEHELPNIPYRIADRAVAQESRLADAALRILRLVGARWTAAEIVELLDLAPVRRAAGFPDDGAARILHWIEETRIRWGRDGAMRHEQFDLPAVEANSWRAGLDRLLMGYAMGRTSELVGDVLPCAGDTIGDPATLGAFSRFLDTLFDTLAGWRTARSLADWAGELRSVFSALLCAEDDDEERELDVVLHAVAELATTELGDASRLVELPVVRDWLEERLGSELTSTGFLSGGMTVGALHPMRVVPHRIVAIAGLDDASFPRSTSRPTFDLLARERRLGDRDRRADDRQLFLDTLMATDERLILSCVAHSPQTNAERATSVVVAELLDVVDRTFVCPDGERARALVEVEHRLQPFSAAYFTGGASSRLFSYSRASARALAAMSSGERNGATPFIAGPLGDASDDAMLDIGLGELIACWSNPSRFFCERTLDIRLPGMVAPLTECEPMTVDQLDRYKVHDDMLRRHLAGGRTPEREREEASALGLLPSGALSGVWFDCLDDELQDLLAQLGDVSLEEPVQVEVNGDSWTLRGRVEGITGRGRLQVRPAACKPTDLIRAWITHVALTAAFGPTVSEVVAKDGTNVFGEVSEPMPILQQLVSGYRAALREPLAFFARASHDYAERLIAIENGNTRVRKSPLEMARTGLDGSDYGEFVTGDLNDVHAALCWRGRDPLDDRSRQAFERWSAEFWRPALAALRAGGAAS